MIQKKTRESTEEYTKYKSLCNHGKVWGKKVSTITVFKSQKGMESGVR